MKFSSISSLAGLLAVASANYPEVPEDHYPEYYHVQYEKVICTDPAPYTKTETYTVTEYVPTWVEPPYTVSEYHPKPTYPPNYPQPYVVTEGPTVTSVDYYGDKTSVWVYPTGYGSHDCTVAVYEKDVIINVVIINIDITIIDGEAYTKTSTVYDRKPTYTPHLPPYYPEHPSYTSYPPHPTGYNPSSTYTSTYAPPYPTDTKTYDNYTPYPSDYIPSSSYPHGTGAYTQEYHGPVTTYNPPAYPPRASAWFA
jgi:hypothetical protein